MNKTCTVAHSTTTHPTSKLYLHFVKTKQMKSDKKKRTTFVKEAN